MNLLTRLTALSLVGVMSLSLLTGCGNTETTSSASGSAPEVIEPVDVDAIEDICTYLTDLPSDQVMATAQGMEIAAGELMYWISANIDELLNYYYYYYGITELPWDTTDESGETTLAQFILNDALRYALLQRLVERRAQEDGITVRQEDKQAIQTAMQTIEEQAKAQGMTAQQLLWERGLTPELYVWNFECDYLYRDIAEKLFGQGSSNQLTEEILRQYKEQKGYYKVKHILLATVDTDTRAELDEETKAQKKKQAEELLSQLKASKEPLALFDRLMTEHSEDPGLVGNPEGYEFQVNTSVDPAFEQAALALEEGQISGIVEGVSGYHIILRLPLEVDVETDREVYILDRMADLKDEWIEQADLKKTKAFETLDVQEFYDRLSRYREAISARIEQNNTQE